LQITVLVLASLLEVAANFAANDVQSGTVRALVRLALPAVAVLMLLVIVGNLAVFGMERGSPEYSTATVQRGPFREDRETVAIQQIADQLATAVRVQWEVEAAVRRLNDPHPLPVSWEAAQDSLLEEWAFLTAAALNWPGGPRSDPGGWAERPAGLRGSRNDLGEVLSRRVPTGRLVVLGEPGAGKTMLLVRLVLDLLARRGRGGAVPVLVPLASWDPREHGLHAWLGARLAMDYVGLREPFGSGGVNRVQALLERRLLVPVLDGLDEMAEAVRGLAITGINDAIRPGEWLVVSSRVAEYRAAICPPTGPSAMLRDTAGIVLHDVDSADVRPICGATRAARSRRRDGIRCWRPWAPRHRSPRRCVRR
jgi:hypothetical protein